MESSMKSVRQAGIEPATHGLEGREAGSRNSAKSQAWHGFRARVEYFRNPPKSPEIHGPTGTPVAPLLALVLPLAGCASGSQWIDLAVVYCAFVLPFAAWLAYWRRQVVR